MAQAQKVRSNTSESERMRIQHQSIKPQQPTTRNSNYHRAPTHPNPQTTHKHKHIRKCLSSSAKVAPSPLPPRRSQQQKPRSRWFPTCSTSKASSPSHQNIHERACALSLSLSSETTSELIRFPTIGSSTPAPRSASPLNTAKPT